MATEYVMSAYLKSKSVIDAIKDQYQEFHYHELDEKTITNLQDNISDKMNMLKRKRNDYKKILISEDRVLIQYELTLISTQKFEILMGISVPERNVMIQIDHPYVIFDHVSLTYAEVDDISVFTRLDLDTLLIPN